VEIDIGYIVVEGFAAIIFVLLIVGRQVDSTTAIEMTVLPKLEETKQQVFWGRIFRSGSRHPPSSRLWGAGQDTYSGNFSFWLCVAGG
jgi:hypothetical protein